MNSRDAWNSLLLGNSVVVEFHSIQNYKSFKSCLHSYHTRASRAMRDIADPEYRAIGAMVITMPLNIPKPYSFPAKVTITLALPVVKPSPFKILNTM